MSEVLFAKAKKGAVIPTKRDEDAGYDLYACFDEDQLVIEPHQTIVIPTGIMTAFPYQYVAVLKERGSTGRLGFGQRGGVYDSGFRGEWTVSLTNHNDIRVIITKKIDGIEVTSEEILYSYKKAIAQILFVPLAELELREVSVDEVKSIKSERGSGRDGSSGK